MNNTLAYTAGHFELSLDQEKTTAYLKSVDGGYMTHNVVDEPIGAANMRIKHAAVADIDPISVEVGMAGSGGILRWIQDSWDRDYQTRSGQINHATFNGEAVFEHEFLDALITETTFPTLDGASKDAAYLKVKFQPRAVASRKRNGGKLSATTGQKQKHWLCSSFRLTIDGIKDAIYTNKLESFTIKQSVKKAFYGNMRGIELTPTKVEFPNLTGTISLAKADGFLAWYDQYIVKGAKDPRAQRGGAIEFLTPDRKQTLFQITLHDVGILKAAMQQSTANAEQIKRVKFELYVGSMRLEGSSALGLD